MRDLNEYDRFKSKLCYPRYAEYRVQAPIGDPAHCHPRPKVEDDNVLVLYSQQILLSHLAEH